MNRSTLILIAVLVVLAVLAYLLYPSEGERETSYKTVNLNVSVDSSTVTKLDIQRPGKAVTLENVGGTWMVTSPVRYKANLSSVTALISSLSKFKVGTLVSSNPDKQSTFQVDSASATRLTATDRSGKSLALLVGKTGPSYSEVYFRVPTSNDVYVGDGLSPWTLNLDVKDWRDRTIFSVPQDSIKGLDIAYKNNVHVYRKAGPTWFAGSDTIPPATITNPLATLANLQAENFVDTIPKIATTPLSIKITSGDQVAIDFYPMPPDSAKYCVRTSKSDQYFTVAKYIPQQFIDLTNKGPKVERPSGKKK